MINGKKVGLCLGSGGARGLAHVGVLQVLEENGIIPDVISGCSAGAIFGAIYAAGTNLYLLEKYLGTVDAKTIIDLGIPIQGGFLSGDKIEEVVMTLTHDLSFGETRIPFLCIATDLVSGEMKGLVAVAVSFVSTRGCFRSKPVEKPVRRPVPAVVVPEQKPAPPVATNATNVAVAAVQPKPDAPSVAAQEAERWAENSSVRPPRERALLQRLRRL